MNRDLRHIRAAIRWAKRRGYISEVPDFKGVFIRENRKKPVIIPEEDFMEMVKALRKPDLVLKHRPADWWRMFLYIGLLPWPAPRRNSWAHLGPRLFGNPGGPRRWPPRRSLEKSGWFQCPLIWEIVSRVERRTTGSQG